jgi:hypothetical protein
LFAIKTPLSEIPENATDDQRRVIESANADRTRLHEYVYSKINTVPQIKKLPSVEQQKNM